MRITQFFSTMILLCFILSGCTGDLQSGNAVAFYYRSTASDFGSETGLFAVEKRYVPYNPTEYEKLIEEYLKGAKSADCTSPFPGGTTLVDFTLRDGSATIVFSPHMALQSQADVITCCTCICKTLFTLGNIDMISIAIEGTQINGEEELTFQKDSLMIWDDTQNNVTANP